MHTLPARNTQEFLLLLAHPFNQVLTSQTKASHRPSHTSCCLQLSLASGPFLQAPPYFSPVLDLAHQPTRPLGTRHLEGTHPLIDYFRHPFPFPQIRAILRSLFGFLFFPRAGSYIKTSPYQLISTQPVIGPLPAPAILIRPLKTLGLFASSKRHIPFLSPTAFNHRNFVYAPCS